MTISLFRSLAISLTLTLAVELTSAWMLGIRHKRDFLLVFLFNIIINLPLVLTLDLVYIYHRVLLSWQLIARLEALAFLTEELLYKDHLVFCRLNPFVSSLILNGVSYFGGLM